MPPCSLVSEERDVQKRWHLQSPGCNLVEGGEDPVVALSGVTEPCFHVCLCRSEDSFKQYFSEMPWLAVPYTDEARRSRLNRLYGIQGRRSRLPGDPWRPAHLGSPPPWLFF